ncbi:BON domain protein [Rubripirellula tenax]|uniref:BON domain protein n=1 Tax=Rubripirellula tenax TaxID=2528015 RepID=A0A5C6EEY9_9BACT|nr:BON domain-containing protein [Rubripirellula tenax]TWU46136.1 BON domain protein [Rubripirellula tenax]
MSTASISEIFDAKQFQAAIRTSAGITRNEKAIAFEDHLKTSGYRELTHVHVLVEDGTVVLRGNVATYYIKQLAQETIRPIAIGMKIKNELTVN